MPDRRVLLLLLAIVAVGCQARDEPYLHRVTRFAMGTMIEYTIAGAPDSLARVAVDQSHHELERVASLLWEDDSLSAVFRFNRSADTVYVAPEVLSFLERSRAYHSETRGAFDITLKPVLSLYGFERDDPLPPAPGDVRVALASVGIDGLSISDSAFVEKKRPGVALAVGGVAKGYGVDRAVRVMKALGIENAVINAGGDLYCLGTNGARPWRVGVRDPDNPASVIQVLHVSDAAVATSGDYQQFFEHQGVRYHHILDPAHGRPARGVRSATVIAPTAERADVLATAAFVLGPSKGVSLLDSLGVEGMVIDSSGRFHVTPGLVKYLDEAAD